MSIKTRNFMNQSNQAQYPGFRIRKKNEGGGLHQTPHMMKLRKDMEQEDSILEKGKWSRFTAFISRLISKIWPILNQG